ncbi:MAG: Septum formation inhibitor MinC [Chloroflexi bacterium]|nr:MAG: Septum formation inhibitor MinC [Chloroflexota bacterium]
MTLASPQHSKSVNAAIVRVVGRGQVVEFTVDSKVSMDEVERGLRDYLVSVKGRFDGGRVTLNMGNRHMTPEQVGQLRTILEKENKLSLSGLSVGADALRDLLETPVPPASATAQAATEASIETAPVAVEAAAPAPPPLEMAAESPDTLLVKGTCRSGTMIHNVGNVVILGDVNPGAEITATGDIIVLGRLGGLAHAGVGGDEDVVVLANNIEATQVRIASHIMMDVPSGRGSGSGRNPNIALVKGGTIVLEPFVARSVWTHEE